MIRVVTIIILTALLFAGSLAEAHMPDRCRRLLVSAEREIRDVVRKSEKARALVKRKESPDRLWGAAEKLLRAMMCQNLALGKAISVLPPKRRLP